MSAADYVFLHGGVQGSWVWDRTLDALAAQTGGAFGRALALDVPGCGAKRGRDTAAIDIDAVAAELVADIEAAGLRDVLLVGHSQAGTVLPRMAELAPGLFRRLVYISAAAPLPGETVLSFRDSMAAAHGEPPIRYDWDEPNTQKVFTDMFCNDMDAAETEAFLARLGEDAWPPLTMQTPEWRYDHLAAIPASYVVCLRDATFPVAWQEAFAERFHAGRLVRIDAAHQVMVTRPHALAEALRFEAAA